MKTVHRFTDEYLERCRDMTADQIVEFLDDFRRLHGNEPSSSKTISLRVPTHLLGAFRTMATLTGTPYQTQIKTLMKNWVLESLEPD